MQFERGAHSDSEFLKWRIAHAGNLKSTGRLCARLAYPPLAGER